MPAVPADRGARGKKLDRGRKTRQVASGRVYKTPSCPKARPRRRSRTSSRIWTPSCRVQRAASTRRRTSPCCARRTRRDSQKKGELTQIFESRWAASQATRQGHGEASNALRKERGGRLRPRVQRSGRWPARAELRARLEITCLHASRSARTHRHPIALSRKEDLVDIFTSNGLREFHDGPEIISRTPPPPTTHEAGLSRPTIFTGHAGSSGPSGPRAAPPTPARGRYTHECGRRKPPLAFHRARHLLSARRRRPTPRLFNQSEGFLGDRRST